MYNGTRDLLNVIWLQLPRAIANSVELDVEHDAHFVRAVAIVKLPNGQVYKADLEPMEFEGVTLYTKLPEAFVAQLCVFV